jgi:hypothetical protein
MLQQPGKWLTLIDYMLQPHLISKVMAERCSTQKIGTGSGAYNYNLRFIAYFFIDPYGDVATVPENQEMRLCVANSGAFEKDILCALTLLHHLTLHHAVPHARTAAYGPCRSVAVVAYTPCIRAMQKCVVLALRPRPPACSKQRAASSSAQVLHADALACAVHWRSHAGCRRVPRARSCRMHAGMSSCQRATANPLST